MSDQTLAYFLSQSDQGWRWSVYDRDGVTVADGAHPSREAAEAAVIRTLQTPRPPGWAYG